MLSLITWVLLFRGDTLSLYHCGVQVANKVTRDSDCNASTPSITKTTNANTNTRTNTSSNTNIRTHTNTTTNAMKYVIRWQVSKKVTRYFECKPSLQLTKSKKKMQMQKETQRQCKDKDNVNTNISSKLHVARFLKGNRRLQMQAHQIKWITFTEQKQKLNTGKWPEKLWIHNCK